ncbi:hypothetical protein BKA16_001702 [Gordonia humi]|uniref:Transposase n=1 Tax=Gordonia humi TaxID=686429 RepID=A0A840F4E9_9ACTN|nr:hypothetical protein [Gordonia humi]
MAISQRRPRHRTARTEAIQLAKRVVELDEQIASNSVRMDELVHPARQHYQRRLASER